MNCSNWEPTLGGIKHLAHFRQSQLSCSRAVKKNQEAKAETAKFIKRLESVVAFHGTGSSRPNPMSRRQTRTQRRVLWITCGEQSKDGGGN